MRETDFRQPDTAAMERLLAAHPSDRAGVVLRLAWRAGLTRDEIVGLSWEQVDGALLRLPEREVPLDAETAACLRQWRLSQREGEAMVMPVAPQSVSRLARQALDEEGQTRVRLLDLRIDCVRRLLETHDWPYVLRVSGFSVTTYRLVLAQFKETESPTEPVRRDGESDELRLWKVMQAERETPAGIALWLSQHLGLTAGEIVSLTWDDLDLDAGVLRLPRGEVSLTQSTRSVLTEERARRAPGDDPHVILTSRTRKPMDAARLSTLVRGALIRGGIENRSLTDMRRGVKREDEERRIVEFARKNGSIMRGDVTELLGVPESTAYNRLLELVENGTLVRINSRYYLPGTVVPPERQSEAIRDYIARYGAAYRQDIAELLHIGLRPTARILNRMVENGELVRLRRSRRYTLPQEDALRAPERKTAL